MSLTEKRHGLYEVPFEIMQLEKDIEELLQDIRNKRNRLEFLKHPKGKPKSL